jgi:hypothetical protein
LAATNGIAQDMPSPRPSPRGRGSKKRHQRLMKSLQNNRKLKDISAKRPGRGLPDRSAIFSITRCDTGP